MKDLPILSGGLAAILILFCASANCVGQAMEIVPPTPNAMKMTEYYSQHPGMYTGTANVSIPLYTIGFDGWDLPLTLSYNATGIRTNEEASEVGLGWALNATGVISRTVTGGDDLYPGTTGGKRGYVYNLDPVTFELGYDWKTEDVPSTESYYRSLALEGPDTQPDIFNFNFFGYSGSFVLSQKADPKYNGKINAIKITKNPCMILFDETAQTFTVITPDGYKGQFSVKERSTTLSSSVVTATRMTCCMENNIDILDNINKGRFRTITSWYLSKITSPKGQEIDFIYDLNPDSSSPYLSNSLSFAELEGITSTQTCLQTIQEHVYLKQILSEEVKVDFTMEMREDMRINTLFTSVASGEYFQISLPLQRYTTITVTGVDSSSTLHKSITLTQNYFNQQFQDRLSGNQNENEVRWMRSRLDRLRIDDQVYQFYYDHGDAGIPDKLTNGVDHFGFYNGQDENTMLLPPDLVDSARMGGGMDLSDTARVDYYRQKWERRVDFAYGKAGLLTKVGYPTGGYTVFEYEPHTYIPDTSTFFREENSLAQSGNLGGGARIKSIKEFDAKDTLLLSKSYRYVEDPTAIPPSPTTGRLMTPLYNRFAHIYYDANNPDSAWGYRFYFTTYSSIPGNSSAEGKIIGYSRVHEIVSGPTTSYVNRYEFVNKPNTILKHNSVAVGYPNLNGQTTEIRNYDSSGKIVQVTQNDDYFHPIDSVKAIAYQQQTPPPNESPGFYLLYYALYSIRGTFNTPYTIITTTASTPSGIVENTNGDIVTWGNSVRTQKNVTYDSSFLLKTEVVINSNCDTIRTEYKRPIDYTAPSLTLVHMLDSSVNIVQPVIEQIVSNNDTVISATGNRYEVQNGTVNLTASYTYNKDLGGFTASVDGYSFSSPYELQAEYSLYDSQKGKLLEYKSRDGITNSFIWGYNGTLPVAHGEGISYNDLYQAHLDATSNPVPDYETAIRTHAKTTGKKVSTYAYNPQVGISRLTDPAGLKKTFEYDTYGRLERVVDNDGKTLEQYAYHFREPPPTRILSVSDDIDFGIVTPDFFDEPLLEHYKKCSDGRTSRILTLSNTGEGDLAVYNLSLPANFTSSWAGGTISPGTSVDVIISFDNNDGNVAPGTYGGTISMSTNKTAGDSLASVTATYAARVCDISFSTSVFNFGRTTGNILNQPLILTNNGNAPIRIIALPLDWNGTTGDYSSTHPDFRVETTIPPPLTTTPICVDAGASLSIPLSYVPTGTSATQTKLSVITDECAALADVVTIKGEKVTLGTPFLDTEASPIEMPEFTGGSTSRTITVSNLSMFSATVESVSSENSKFTISPSGGFVLDGFGEKTFTLTFAPNAGDFSPQSSIIHFNGNIAETTFSRTVTGQRTEVRTVSLSTSQIMIQGHSAGTLTVTNNGNSNVTLTGVKYEVSGGTYTSSPNPSWWSAGFTPVATPTLGPLQSTTMSIQSTSSNSQPQNIQVQYSKTGPLNANDVVQAVAINRNISVSSITFQNFEGPTATTNFVISNPDGNATLTVQNITSSNSRFTLSASPALAFPFYLDPGQSRTVSVTYTPTDFSLQTSNIVVTSNATNATGPITAVASAQRTEVRTVSLSASQVTINGHGSGSVTVTNNGNTSLTLTGVKYAAPGGSYSTSSTSWSAGFTPVATPTLAPGQATTLNIQSISSASEAQNIQVQYSKTSAYNASDQVLASPLNRNITVSAITFPSFTAASVSTNFTVSNPNGNAALRVDNITSSNARFTFSASPALTFPFSLDPGQSRTISVTYTPTDFSSQTSTITFSSNATNITTGPLQVSTAAQRTAIRTIALSPGTVTASGYQWKSVTVNNTGNDNLTVTGVAYAFLNTSTYTSGSSSWTTSFSSGLPVTLGPGQGSSFSVMPIGSNPDDQKIRVEYNKTSGYTSSDEIQAFAEITRELNGVPSSYAFSSFTGSSASYPITVSNGGNSTLTISSISSNNSRFTASPTSLTLGAGASQTVTITYNPTDFSMQSGTITFNSDRTGGNSTMSVSGQRTQYYHISVSSYSVVIKPSFQTVSSYLTNTGNVNATINSVGNSNPSKFRVTVYRYVGGWRTTASFPAVLSPGQQLEVEVKSADGSFTSATGYAQVTPDQGSAFNINLSRSPTP